MMHSGLRAHRCFSLFLRAWFCIEINDLPLRSIPTQTIWQLYGKIHNWVKRKKSCSIYSGYFFFFFHDLIWLYGEIRGGFGNKAVLLKLFVWLHFADVWN